jgi:CDP-diacylglycerol--glycerol-3-phosphate 3-phosphatidyltransferase
MATIYDLKPAFQNRLRPLTRRLAGRGFTANQVTLAALALSLATGALLAAMGRTRPEMYLMLPAVLFIRMALNAVDGMLAREHGMQSALGAVLNELSDAISDTALYLPFALLPGVSPAWVVLAVAGALLTEMAGVVAVQIGASRRYDGPMGKSDRAFVFGAGGLAVGTGTVPGIWLDGLFGIVLALSLLTVVNRSRRALQETAE